MKKVVLVISLLCGVARLTAQQDDDILKDTFTFYTDTSYVSDSLRSDSLFYSLVHAQGRWTILDSISNDSLLRKTFKPYLDITNVYSGNQSFVIRRDIPTLKEVYERESRNDNWKFWVVLFILTYIALIRITNSNNFRLFILSVFNMKLSEKIWEEHRSIFGSIIFQLFAIYIFIASLFITCAMEITRFSFNRNGFYQFVIIVGILMLVYIVKFIIHTSLGYLLKMKKLAIGFVSNTVSVNNFIALVIFPFIIFMIYNQHTLWTNVLNQAIVSLFFVSVIYRVGRIFFLGNVFFSFPRIYLILYLCSLEILPWLLIIKFINTAAV